MKSYVEEGIQIVELEGSIQQAQTDELEKILESFHARRHHNVIVDLSKVNHVCSSALGVLVTYKRLYKQEKGDLKLIITDENLQQLFEITMLDKVFEISETKKEAIEKFD